jgi:hypothetical protein
MGRTAINKVSYAIPSYLYRQAYNDEESRELCRQSYYKIIQIVSSLTAVIDDPHNTLELTIQGMYLSKHDAYTHQLFVSDVELHDSNDATYLK